MAMRMTTRTRTMALKPMAMMAMTGGPARRRRAAFVPDFFDSIHKKTLVWRVTVAPRADPRFTILTSRRPRAPCRARSCASRPMPPGSSAGTWKISFFIQALSFGCMLGGGVNELLFDPFLMIAIKQKTIKFWGWLWYNFDNSKILKQNNGFEIGVGILRSFSNLSTS